MHKESTLLISLLTYQPNIVLFNHNKITIAVLQNPNNLPKNSRFHNKGLHKYNLRSSTEPPTYPYLIAQHMFDINYSTNHIFTEDRKRETIDSLLQGSNGITWNRRLSNK